MSSWSRLSRRAGIEAAAWSGAALIEWSTHWSRAAASTVMLGGAAYLRRQRPLAAALLLALGFVLQAQLGVPLADADDPYVPLVFAIVLAYTLGSGVPTVRSVSGLAVLLVTICAGYLWSSDGPVLDAFLPVLGLGAPWAAGRVVFSLRRTARELAARTEELQAAQQEISRLSAQAERRRIARELHDVVAHAVTLMVVQAGAAERMLRTDPSAAAAALRRVQDAGRGAIGELSRMLGILSDAEEDGTAPIPSEAELPALARSVSEAGLDTRLFVDPAVADEALPPGLALAVYRITQEALTNAMRRGATEAWVSLRGRSPGVELEILTGGGGEPALAGVGRGMEGMQERAALYGGTLEASALTDGRFRLLARLAHDAL